MNRRVLSRLTVLCFATACGAAPISRPLPDGGEEIVGDDDAGAPDAGFAASDGGQAHPDAGSTPFDAGAPDAGRVTPDAGHPVDAGPPPPTCGYAIDQYTAGSTCEDGTCSAPYVEMTGFVVGPQCFDCRGGICDNCGASGQICCLGTSCRGSLLCTDTNHGPKCQ